MASTKTHIGKFNFENCFMNAAGVYCFDREELEKILNSEAGTFVTKAATLNPRDLITIWNICWNCKKLIQIVHSSFH